MPQFPFCKTGILKFPKLTGVRSSMLEMETYSGITMMEGLYECFKKPSVDLLLRLYTDMRKKIPFCTQGYKIGEESSAPLELAKATPWRCKELKLH